MSLVAKYFPEKSDIKPIDVKSEKYPKAYKALPNLWRVSVLLSIVINYYATSVTYVLLEHTDSRIYYLILLLDAIYLVNLMLSVVHFIWMKSRLRLNKAPGRSKLVLIMDCVFAFPSSYLYEALSSSSYNHHIFLGLRTNVQFRLFHLWLYFKEKRNTPGINHIKYFAIFFMAFFIIWLHTGTCIWYALNFLKNSTNIFSTLNQLNVKYESTADKYVISTYYTLTIRTNRMFGDMVPTGTEGKVLAVFNMLVGCLLLTIFFIGVLSFLLEQKYKRRIILQIELQSILKFLQFTSISRKVLKNIENSYRALWAKNKSVREASHGALLPYPLRSEISIDINIDFLQASIIFKNKPSAFLRMVSTLIKHEFYQKNEIIYHQNIAKNKMIFVAVGSIEVLSNEDGESPIMTLGTGACLGESSLVLTLPAKSTVRTASYTELHVLHRRDFYNIMELFPKVHSDIRRTVLSRIAKVEDEEEKDTNTIQAFKNTLSSIPEVTELTAKSVCVSEKFPWILNPNGSLRLVWETFIIIIILYMSLTYPYFIVFLKEYPPWFEFLFNITDLVLIMDILIILTTAVEEKNQTIKTFVTITQKRLTELGFYLDLVGAIKVELFYWIWTKNIRYSHVLKLNRLLKIYRIPKFIRKLEDKRQTNFYWAECTFCICLFSYWFGSFFYLVTCFEERCTEDGWFFKKLLEITEQHQKHSYISYNVLTANYFALTCLTGLTVGDIIPTNIIDMLITCFAFVCGIFTFGCAVAHFAAVLVTRLRRETDFQEVLSLILKYMKDKHVTTKIMQKVKSYLLLQWHYDRASVLNDRSLLHNLDENISTRIHIDDKMETIKSIRLFQDLSPNFLLSLVIKAKSQVLPPNYFIVYKGEIVKNLYIIVNGHCIRQFEKSYLILKPKAFFGTVCLFSNVSSLSSVKTLSHVRIICIPEHVFWTAAAAFPTITTLFKEVCENFDVLTEFNKLAVHPTISEIIDLETHSLSLEGSFCTVTAYCKQHGENYSAPFQNLGIFCWIQMLMVPFCILPHGAFLKIWMLMRLIVAIIIIILTPYQIINISSTSIVDRIVTVSDCITYFDLYVMMFVGYHKKGKNQLIIHPLKTAVHYLKGKFMVDFIVCFPWEIPLSYFIERDEMNLYKMIKIIKMGQVYRLVQFFNHTTYFRRQSCILQVLKHVAIFLVAIHCWTTVLLANSCKYLSQDKGGHNSTASGMYCNEDSWIDKSKFRNFTKSYQMYTTSLYFSTQILTLCGFGDVAPQYFSTLIIIIVMIIYGILSIGYLYAQIASCTSCRFGTIFKNREIICEMNRFMVKENVEKKLKQQIIARLEYKWIRNQGVEHHNILNKLSSTLHKDIFYVMFEKTLRNVPIFENIDKSFLRLIGTLVKEQYYFKQETIYNIDDIVDDICFVVQGKVRVVSPTRHIEAFMGLGGIFGNLTPNARNKISVTVTASNNVDLLFINAASFFGLLEEHPTEKHIILNNLRMRTDFVLPTFRTSHEEFSDTESYEETASANFVQNIRDTGNLGVFMICLPWKLFRFTIPQSSIVFTIFDIYFLVLTYLSSLLVIYEFAFQDHTLYFLLFGVYVDSTFIFKILLDMHKTYENRFGETITSNRKIIRRYFRNHNIRRSVDFVINCPFYYLAFFAALFSKFDAHLYFSSMKMVTLLRLLNVYDYFNEKFNQILSNKLILKFSTILIWGTLIIHIFACGWYLCACPLKFCYTDSWINHLAVNMNEKLDVYITCLYFISTLLTKTGTGDIVAFNVQEQVYVVIVMICTIFLTGKLIGEVWSLLNCINARYVKYHYDITNLKYYLQNNKINDYQMNKTLIYARQLWTTNRGTQFPEAFSHLHSATFSELMENIYGQHLTTSYIFSGTEESFVRQVCQYLKRIVFFPGNYIVQHGDFDNTMYFIHYGEVDILTVHSNLTETVHEILHGLDMFGAIQGLYEDVPHYFSYRTRTTVHVLALRFSDWKYLLDFFPESRESIFTKTNRINV